MPRGHHARVCVAVAVALLAGCASRYGTVVLLPEKDGRDTAVVVRQGDQQIVLAQPYAAANLTSSGPRAYTANPADVQARGRIAPARPPHSPW